MGPALIASILLSTALVQQPAPEFVGRPGDWVNSKPLTLKGLQGKVVLVDFWEYTCVNCIRTFPYVREWYRRYHKSGFEMVAIHTPEFEFSSHRDNVAAAAKRYGLEFPILLDGKRENWERYRVEAWPTKVLLDARGVPIHAFSGEGESEKFETLIQRELKRANPGLKLPPVMKPVHSAHQVGAICNPKTPEIFTGKRGHRDGQFAQPGLSVGKTTALVLPKSRPRGALVLGGLWKFADDHIESRRPGAAVAFNFAGIEANAVLRSEKPLDFEVLIDGKPATDATMGDDVVRSGSRTVVTVREPRMYNLVKTSAWGRHDLELRISRAGLRVHTFSFSTDCARINPSAR